MGRFHSIKYPLLAVVALCGVGGVGWHFLFGAKSVPEAKELNPFVQAKPVVPVVFTSRTEPTSFDASAPQADGFHYPGTIPWAAREGRLRLLDTDGKVYELTWGRTLPGGGGALVDVMSPSVSLDGKRILFAGRKAAPDPGRWRIYEVGVNGRGLKALTGGPTDPGCVASPPLRYGSDGTRMTEADRRRLDYDDVDPTDLGPSGFAFASSRLPDLGRDHARRATQIWKWQLGADAPAPLSANRNNDRWPVLVAGDQVLFSQWSRNREAVTADFSDVRPISAGGSFATEPTDQWTASWVTPNAAQVGFAVKCTEPVWRPRPLFNGRVTFMTATDRSGRRRIAQADWGYLRSAPSSLAPGANVPDLFGGALLYAPDRDSEGHELTAGSPNPTPGGGVLFSAAPVGSAAVAFGLYSVSDDWVGGAPAPQLLFNDPAFADGEPVAVYARGLTPVFREEPIATGSRPASLMLADGRAHAGPVAYLENLAVLDAIRSPIPRRYAPTDRAGDPRYNPVIPPPTNVTAVAFYAAHRDRFDDSERPRVTGGWEKLMVAPVTPEGALQAWVPSDPLTPTVLVGLDAGGKVAKWTGTTKDAAGRTPTYVAFAGDHYSGTRPNGYHYCNGCHTGHTFDLANVRERQK